MQQKFVNDAYHLYAKDKKRKVVSKHFYFIDFRDFDKAQPVYVNLVRDPVAKIVSRFCYKRLTTPLTIPPKIHSYCYSRYTLMKTKRQFKLINNSVLEPWKNKDLDACIQTGDPECNFGRQTEFTMIGLKDPVDDLSIVKLNLI